MKYIDAEKLIAEIKRLYEKYRDAFHQHKDDYHLGLYDGLDMAIRVIDSLPDDKPRDKTCRTCVFYENDCPFVRGKFMPYPSIVCKDYTYSGMQEQPSEDLEKAVKSYFNWYWPGTKTPEQCNTTLIFTPPAILRLVQHFAQWQKEQIMKEAVDGVVEYNFDENGRGYYAIRPAFVEETVGTKGKIIFVKEDEK